MRITTQSFGQCRGCLLIQSNTLKRFAPKGPRFFDAIREAMRPGIENRGEVLAHGASDAVLSAGRTRTIFGGTTIPEHMSLQGWGTGLGDTAPGMQL